MQAKTATMASILNIGVVGAAILVTYFGVHGQLRTQVVGLICLTPMVAMYASPLAVLVIIDYTVNFTTCLLISIFRLFFLATLYL